MAFADRVLAWYDDHGRHDLPWQQQRTPYRVWVAEVMLQQTQVATVIPYYQRFLQSFPDVAALAGAPLDSVLEHWAGLGYYSRARNLHAAARRIVFEHAGVFPERFDDVVALPGIGRSTAGAILAQALDQRHAILDGNVKRVLCRYHAVEGWPGQAAVQKRLWACAEQHTPQKRVADYTQAIMDLGATLCTRSAPRCTECPLVADCRAQRTGRVTQFPSPRPRRRMPVRAARFLILTDTQSGQIMLEKRDTSGIWGGLWSLPEIEVDASIEQACRQRWGLEVLGNEDCDPFRHTFSHYHLDITPCRVRVRPGAGRVEEASEVVWCPGAEAAGRALAAPVARIIRQHAGA